MYIKLKKCDEKGGNKTIEVLYYDNRTVCISELSTLNAIVMQSGGQIINY